MYVVLTSTNLGFERVLEQLLLLVSRGTWVFLYGVITEKAVFPQKFFRDSMYVIVAATPELRNASARSSKLQGLWQEVK